MDVIGFRSYFVITKGSLPSWQKYIGNEIFSIIAFAMTKVWLRSLPISARTRYAPGWFKTNKIGPTFSFQVAAIETRSLPSSLAAAPSRLYLLSRRSLGSVDLNPESVRGSGERSGPGDRDTDGQAEG